MPAPTLPPSIPLSQWATPALRQQITNLRATKQSWRKIATATNIGEDTLRRNWPAIAAAVAAAEAESVSRSHEPAEATPALRAQIEVSPATSNIPAASPSLALDSAVAPPAAPSARPPRPTAESNARLEALCRQGLSYNQIAQAEGLDRATVYGRIHQLRLQHLVRPLAHGPLGARPNGSEALPAGHAISAAALQAALPAEQYPPAGPNQQLLFPLTRQGHARLAAAIAASEAAEASRKGGNRAAVLKQLL